MNELTDLQICKRIAEIEGVEFRIQNGKVLPENPAEAITGKLTDVYNPLTDDALCFKLMVKHSIRVEPENCSAWTNNDDGYPKYEVIHCKGTINKAICLAIIKSKE
jgi:hypothetical protein